MPSLRPAVVLVVALCGVLGARPALAGRGDALLKYLPEDTEVVASLNLAKGRGTPLLRAGLDAVGQRLGASWQSVPTASFDPARDLDTIVLGWSPDEQTGGSVMLGVLEGRLDGFARALRKQPAQRQGGVEVWRWDQLAVLFVDKRAIVCAPEALSGVVATLTGKRANARRSRKALALRAGVAAADTRGDAWIAAGGKSVPNLPVAGALNWISGSVAAQRGLVMEIKVDTDVDATAAALVDWTSSQLPLAKQVLASQGLGSMADSIEVKNTGALLVVGMVMSEVELTNLLAALSQQRAATGGAKSP
jgi:hypothetical protein